MNKIILTLFLISSCNGTKIKNDVRRVWSFNFSTCYCQMYSFSEVDKIDDLVRCEELSYFKQMIDADNAIEDACEDEEYEKENKKLCKRIIKNKKNCKKPKYFKKNAELCTVLPNKMYCDDLVGFSKNSWARNITPNGRAVKAYFEDRCQ